MKLSALKVAAVASLFVISGTSLAQNCQWRQEGTRGPGWYDSGGGACADAQQAPVSSRWITRWGAVATSNATFNMGVAANQESKRTATQLAMRRCGAPDCTVDITYHDQCVAVAWGTKYSSMSAASTSDEAIETAMKGCRKGANDCEIVYIECSLPERIQ